MRPIKFRAFQKSKGIMRNVWEINFEGADDSLRYIKIDDGKRLYPEDNDFVLMQFTGFYDKNGKEVYEGDILRLNGGVLAKVVYKNGSLQILKITDFKEDQRVYSITNYFEIIGNIHENIDLIK